MSHTFAAHQSLACPGDGWQVVHTRGSDHSVIQAGMTEDAAKLLAGNLEAAAGGGKANEALRERSGKVDVHDDRLTSFLYDLVRDHLPPGTVERLVREADPD